MSFEIYKLTCMVDGRVYIGVTSRTSGKRFWDHTWYARMPLRRLKSRKRPTVIQRALRIHGPERFTVEVIDRADSKEDAWQKERYWIHVYESNKRPKGYNRTSGGEGIFASKSVRLEDIF